MQNFLITYYDFKQSYTILTFSFLITHPKRFAENYKTLHEVVPLEKL